MPPKVSSRMNSPRRMTDVEIEKILDKMDPPPGSTLIQRKYALDIMKKSLRVQLSDIKIVEEGIPMLEEEILRNYNNAKVTPGLTVGPWSAEAQGRMIQQATLDLFHNTGKANAGGASSGVDSIKEVLNVSKHPKNPSMQIHFTEPQDFDSIYEFRRNGLVKVSLKTIYKEHSIEYASTYFDSGHLPWWYYVSSEVYGMNLPQINESDRFLRLQFNPNFMVEYGVVMDDIYDTLVEKKPLLFRLYVSPIDIGIVDIWPISDAVQSSTKKLMNIPQDLAIFTFLQNILVPKLDLFMIKGVPEISEIYPQDLNMWFSLFGYESEGDDSKTSKIYCHIRYKILGPTWERTLEMLDKLGVKVLKDSPYEHLTCEIPEGFKSVDSFMKKKINAFNDLQKKNPEQAKKNDIGKYFKYYYGITSGSNLRAVLALPYVDKRTTRTNVALETLAVLGREAAHATLLMSLYEILQFREDSPINDRHPLLTIDNMGRSGNFLPNNFIGIMMRDNTNYISAASSEQQHGTYLKGASMGIRQDAKHSVSAIITYGGLPRIGPKAFDRDSDERKGITEKELQERLNNGRNPLASSAEISDALESMIANQFSSDPTRQLIADTTGNDLDDAEGENLEDFELFDPLAAIDREDETMVEDVSGGVSLEELSEIPSISKSSAIDYTANLYANRDPHMKEYRDVHTEENSFCERDEGCSHGDHNSAKLQEAPEKIKNLGEPYSPYVEDISLGIDRQPVTKVPSSVVKESEMVPSHINSADSKNSKSETARVPKKFFEKKEFKQRDFVDEDDF